MKKVIMLILTILLSFTLSGCFDKEEVENMTYLMALGVDNGKDFYEYTFQFASFDEGLNLKNYTAEGETVYTALNKINGKFAKKVDFSQLRAVVFSDNLKSNKLKYQLDFLVENPDINPNVSLGFSKGNAKDFMEKIISETDTLPTRFYEKIFNPEYSVYAPKSTIRDIERNKFNVIPYVSDTLEGMVIYGNGKIIGKAEGNDVRLYSILSNTLTDTKFDYYQGDEFFVVGLSSFKPVYSVQLKPTTVITIDLNLECEPIVNEKNFNEAFFEKILKSKTEDFLQKCATDYKADIFSFGNHAKKYYLTSKDWEAEDWEGLFSKADFKVNVNINNVRK